MTTGLTKVERLAVDRAIDRRIRELETMIVRYTDNDGLKSVRLEWRDQRDALLTARPKVAVMHETS